MRRLAQSAFLSMIVLSLALSLWLTACGDDDDDDDPSAGSGQDDDAAAEGCCCTCQALGGADSCLVSEVFPGIDDADECNAECETFCEESDCPFGDANLC